MRQRMALLNTITSYGGSLCGRRNMSSDIFLEFYPN